VDPAHLLGEKARFGLAGCGFCRLASFPSSANHPLELDGHDAFAWKHQDRLYNSGLTHYGGILFFQEFLRVLQFRRSPAQRVEDFRPHHDHQVTQGNQ
jgi:hypothetical protein